MLTLVGQLRDCPQWNIASVTLVKLTLYRPDLTGWYVFAGNEGIDHEDCVSTSGLGGGGLELPVGAILRDHYSEYIAQ